MSTFSPADFAMPDGTAPDPVASLDAAPAARAASDGALTQGAEGAGAEGSGLGAGGVGGPSREIEKIQRAARGDAAMLQERGGDRSGVSPEAAAQNAQSQVLGSFNGPERADFEADEGEVKRHLERVAALIEAGLEGISAAWRGKVSRDVLLASSPSWSRRQFDDHIPEMMEVLCAKMRSWPETASLHASEQGMARAHSKHRWQQGYDMRSLTREWGHLNACLLEALDRMALEPGQARRVAQSLIAEIILESSSESVSEYARLLQAEAAARARQLEAAIEALREEERGRGQMLREAAHDLRGSLGIVSGSASIIDRKHMDQDDRAEVGRLLRRGVHSLHEMMTDLIDLARLEAGEEQVASRRFDVSQIMRELGATSLPLAQAKSLGLEIEGPPELTAWGDPIKARRVAQNLLLNSIKYTDSGAITLAWAPDGDDRWLLRISDTGPGLHTSPATVAAALHEATNASRAVEGRTPGEQNPAGQAPQPTATPNNPRTGLTASTDDASTDAAQSNAARLVTGVPGEGVGLSIVKRLCDLMGASLELDTQPGAGSTFRVLFPRTPSSMPSGSHEASPAPASGPQSQDSTPQTS